MKKENKKSNKIVFIESDKLLRVKYAEALTNEGFEVEEICDGKEANKCLQNAQKSGIFPDLVILAIIMPGIDGFDLLEKINSHEICTNIPKIVFTTLDNEQDRSTAFDLGVREYLIKDQTSPAQLVSLIKKAFKK